MRFCPQDGTALVGDHSPKPTKTNGAGQENGTNGTKKPEPNGSSAESIATQSGEDELKLDDNVADNSNERADSLTITLNTSGDKPSSMGDPRLELLGEVIEDRYEITETLGKGGMSVVFKARDRRLKKMVAVKVLMPHLSVDALSVQRFQQEATAASHLDHPNIVKVYNVGATKSGLPFMAMDYLEGHSLSAVIKEKGRLEYTEALNVFVQLTGALAHAHGKGVIHRDLKPSNVILSHQGQETDVAKLVDFGIAKVLSQEGHTQAKLTQTGDVFGSPHYMSPEQCLGGELDERSDVYSMGCLMYEVLTGRPPHTGDSTLQILHKHISETPASFKSVIPETSTSAQLESIVFKCLAPKRDDRIQSMKQLQVELTKLYMVRDKNLINQVLAKLSLAWGKRPKLSAREKALAASGLVVSLLVLGFGFFTFSFFDLTSNSPWLNPSILTWIPPKPPSNNNDDKMSLAFSQVDMYIKRGDKLVEEGAITKAQLIKSLTNTGLGMEQAGRLEDAARSLEAASKAALKYISKYSTNYVNLLFYKGRVYYEMEKYDIAVENLKGCLESNEWPASMLWKGDCEAYIGDCYNFLGNRAAAEDYYQRALDRWKDDGSDSTRFSVTAARLGDLIIPYNTQKSFAYAHMLFRGARSNWRRHGDEQRQNIALCDLRISQVLAGVADKEKSFLYLKEANIGLASVLGEDNPKRAAVMMKYADALWQRGEYVAALQERFNCWLILSHAAPPQTTRAI